MVRILILSEKNIQKDLEKSFMYIKIALNTN